MEQPFTRILIPLIKTITNFRLGMICFYFKNFTGNNVKVWFDLKKKKKHSKTKMSLLDLKVAPIQTEGNKKAPSGLTCLNRGKSGGNVKEGIALLFSADEINVL